MKDIHSSSILIHMLCPAIYCRGTSVTEVMPVTTQGIKKNMLGLALLAAKNLGRNNVHTLRFEIGLVGSDSTTNSKVLKDR